MSKMLNRIYNRFARKFLSMYSKQCLRSDIKHERENEEQVSLLGVPGQMYAPLTNAEKDEVKALWGQVVDVTSYKEFEVYKGVRGFDARFLPFHFYLPLISRRLNNYKYSKILEHKSFLGRLTHGSLPFPYCIVRSIDGHYYSNDMSEITLEDVLDECINEDRLILKISEESSGGHGVLCLEKNGEEVDAFKERIKKELAKIKADFVVQKCLRQHSSMAKYNSSSINTLRIQTLYLNGVFSVGSIILRMGIPGNIVDNLSSGGIVVGVNKDGFLNETGFDSKLTQYKNHGSVVFKGERIVQIKKILEMVEDDHIHQFAVCKYIGWDIMIDEENQPICLEVNTSQNGVLPFQICCGPVFGNRTQEVIDYCKTKPFKYGRSAFAY